MKQQDKKNILRNLQPLQSTKHRLKIWYRFIAYHYPEMGRLLQFLGVGALGFILNLAILTFLLALEFHINVALIAGITTSTVVNFIGDRMLVFSYARHKGLFSQLIGFILVCLLGGNINYQITKALLLRFDWLIPQIALIGGIIIATVFNYLCLRYLVFKKETSLLG